MGLFGRIIIGLIGIAVGTLLALKHSWIIDNIGRLDTIDRYMGSFGGTRVFLILLGALIAILSVLYIFGVIPP